MRIYYSRYENEMVMTALQNVQEYQGIFYRSSSEEMNRLQRKLFYGRGRRYFLKDAINEIKEGLRVSADSMQCLACFVKLSEEVRAFIDRFGEEKVVISVVPKGSTYTVSLSTRSDEGVIIPTNYEEKSFQIPELVAERINGEWYEDYKADILHLSLFDEEYEKNKGICRKYIDSIPEVWRYYELREVSDAITQIEKLKGFPDKKKAVMSNKERKRYELLYAEATMQEEEQDDLPEYLVS